MFEGPALEVTVVSRNRQLPTSGRRYETCPDRGVVEDTGDQLTTVGAAATRDLEPANLHTPTLAAPSDNETPRRTQELQPIGILMVSES